MANDEQFSVVVHAITRETDTVQVYDLRSVTGEALAEFSAGAHIDLLLENGLTRSYSLVNSTSERHRYEVAVDRVPSGRGGSCWIHDNVSVGDTLRISKPRNLFPLEASATHSVLIAGGIGVTPLLCMARDLELKQRSWELHYCVRDAKRAAFNSVVSQSYEHGQVIMHFSDSEGMPDLRSLVSTKPQNTHFYCCGPAGMLDAFLDVTSSHDPQFVHIERFSGAKAAVDGNFDLILSESQRTLRVMANETILERLLKEGIEVPNSCGEGVCGSCEVPLLAGQADHRDMILTDDEKAANKSIFVCCSGSLGPSLTLKL